MSNLHPDKLDEEKTKSAFAAMISAASSHGGISMNLSPENVTLTQSHDGSGYKLIFTIRPQDKPPEGLEDREQGYRAVRIQQLNEAYGSLIALSAGDLMRVKRGTFKVSTDYPKTNLDQAMGEMIEGVKPAGFSTEVSFSAHTMDDLVGGFNVLLEKHGLQNHIITGRGAA